MSNEMLKIKELIVKQSVKLHILSHNLSDVNNQISVISEIEIDWESGFVSFKALHSGIESDKQYSFYELDLEGLNV